MRSFTLVLAVLLTCWCASAQEPPESDAAPPAGEQGAALPTVEEPAAPRSFLDLHELTFDLGFDGHYERRQVITDADRARRRFRFQQLNEVTRLEETLGMRTSGTLFGERVMRFDISLRGGLEQERFFEERPGRDLVQDPHGGLLEYDFKLEFLPAGKISGLVYGSQVDDRIPRQFLPSIDRRREQYGVGVFFNDRTLPMRLTFDHLYDELRSGVDRLDDDEDRNEDTLRYEATWQPTDYHSLRLEYEYNDRQERYSGTDTRFDTTRNYLTLDHSLRFGNDHLSRLDTLVRFQDETGDLARDTFELSPQLRLQHTPSLASTYKVQYLRDSFEQTQVDQYRGDIGLIHQWADRLTTHVDFYGLQQDTSERGGGRYGGIDNTEWGGSAGATYSQDNAAGRFSANLNYTHTALRASDGDRRGFVIGESVTFRDPLPAYLSHQNIIEHSVIVTDARRARIFVPYRDYVVIRVNRYSALLRVRGGRIADRETVLVSYTYRAYNGYELSRDRIDFRVQQDFKFGLTPYYASSIQDEDLDRDNFLTWRARNVNRHRVGATYRRPRWSIGLEYEYNDDAIDPYQSLTFNGDVTLIEKARQTLTGRTSLARFWFDGSDGLRSRDSVLFDAGLNYRYLLAPNLEAVADARYRYEDDSLFGITNGVDFSSSVQYRIGLFSVLLEAEYDLLDLPESNDGTLAFWLKVRREIPVIARPAQ